MEDLYRQNLAFGFQNRENTLKNITREKETFKKRKKKRKKNINRNFQRILLGWKNIVRIVI